MCWDQKTSITTFVVGTLFNLFNIFYFKNTTITVVSLIWQWVLLMQLFEAIGWGSKPGSSQNKMAAQGAMIANITQPIIVGLLLVAFSPVSTTNKAAAMTLIFGYICWLLYSLNNAPTFETLSTSKDCYHLDLVWWKHLPGGGMMHILTLVGVLALLLRPMEFMIFETGFIIAALALSMMFYSCGAGSIWCWFAAFAPMLTTGYVLWKGGKL